jgi:hypothetical protein
MSTRPLPSWPAKIACAITLVACSSSDGPGGPQGSAGGGGVLGDAGGAPGTSGSAGLGGSNGGTAQAGTSGGGQGGQAGSGMNCGLEICSGAKQCCASTGKCYNPSFEPCNRVSCTVTSTDTGGSAGAANCCTMGLLHCAATGVCYHPACVGCCS